MLEILENRRSIREFTEEKIKLEELEKIMEIGLRAPTFANTQIISLVCVTDEKKKERLAEISGNQQHIKDASALIVVVIDYYKSKKILEEMNENIGITNDIEGVISGSIDAGLVLSQIQTAAHTLGYGTTVIGGIRQNTEEVIKLLELPKYTYPIIATTIGVPKQKKVSVKLPRMEKEGTIFFEKYDEIKSFTAIKNYDKMFSDYCGKINVKLTPFNQVLINYLTFKNGKSKTNDVLIKQGFEFNF